MASLWRIEVALHLDSVKIQALQLSMIEVQTFNRAWMWFEEDTLIGILTVDMQLSLGAISHLQGLKVNAVIIFFDTPTFIIWPECSNGWVLNRLSIVIHLNNLLE